MRYLALATDYDDTLAAAGRVAPSTLTALRRVHESGRKLVLVTGRELPNLQRIFPEHAIFDRIVAENGALVYAPESGEERVLAEAPPAALVTRLRAEGIEPLSHGRVIVATRSPHEKRVLEIIHELGLELQVIFNRGAVMVLPTGINKAKGLRVALRELMLSPHNAVAIGDAENDHALLAECEFAAAVENALPMLKARADLVTKSARGDGVCELIEQLLSTDLRDLAPRLARHDITLGTRADGVPIKLHPYGNRVLLCGTSGSGKSTLLTAFLECLVSRRYQFCLIDPEGDFDAMPDALALGDGNHPPSVEEVISALRTGDKSVIVSLMGLPLEQRSDFFVSFMARCVELRTLTGRPHFIVADEAHHMLPAGEVELASPIAHPPTSLLLATVHPEQLSACVLRRIKMLLLRGSAHDEAITSFARAHGSAPPIGLGGEPALGADEALCWTPGTNTLERFRPLQPRSERRRHQRKYAQGALGEDKSFYFRGPANQFRLRAHNLMLFLQIGDGIDDATWLHHLAHHDYSQWIREAIKNEALADEVERIEREHRGQAQVSRQHIRKAIEKVYTLPA